MPFYDFWCPDCNTQEEILCTVSKRPREGDGTCPVCPECKKGMVRKYMGQCVGGNKEYGTPLVSDALAMNPEQIPEHNRLFPDIKVAPDGRPVFETYNQHDKYLKATGFQKMPQKIKPKGKIIA